MNRGNQQAQFLKALDFDDVVVHGWRIYNVIRARLPSGCTCRMSYPGQHWHQPNRKSWAFYDRLDRGMFVERELCLEFS